MSNVNMYLVVTSCLMISLAFMYLVVEKIENKKNVKISIIPLFLLLISFLISFVQSIFNTNINILLKIFWFLSVLSVCSLISLKLFKVKDNFCNEYKSFEEDKYYDKYYNKVIRRNKFDLIQPYKKVFDRYLK